jgi:Fe-S cluster assembly protein SufD
MISQHQALQSQFPLTGSGQTLRSLGMERFLELGMPSRKLEEWHYTSLKELSAQDFELAILAKEDSKFLRTDVPLLNSDFFNLVFVNGKFQEQLSDLSSLKTEVSVQQLTQIDGASFLAKHSQLKSLEALNQSFFQQGLVIEVPDEVSVSRPVQVIQVLTNAKAMAHPRLSVRLGKRARLSLVESYISKSSCWQNSVSEIRLEESAKLEYLRLQNESREAYNTGLTRIEVLENASLESLSFMSGGRLGRHDVEVFMSGVQSSARVQGLTLGSESQHLDHNTLIDHVVGGCTTSQLYKSVLNHKARSVFTGMVKIRAGAQKALSEQLNNNLLLSRDAEADSRPQLEILADDVKATHGSTVGQLNAEELFYLLSRAIPRTQALEMLSLGFVQDLVFQVSHPKVKGWLADLLVQSYRHSMGDVL